MGNEVKFSRFEKLQNEALAIYADEFATLQGRSASASGEAKEALEKKIEDLRAKATTDSFLFAGIDLKGAANYAQAVVGSGFSVDASFNPFGVLGLNTEFSVGAGGAAAQQRGVLVLRGPSFAQMQMDASVRDVANSIVVNSFRGARFTFSLEAGAEVSIGWVLKTGGGATTDGQTISTQDLTSSARLADEEDDGATSMELLAIGLDMRLGAAVGGNYDYETFFADDPDPLYYAPDEANSLRHDLNLILAEGSAKGMHKKMACDVINDDKNKYAFKGRSRDPSLCTSPTGFVATRRPDRMRSSRISSGASTMT
jgi:hypothetical protein